MKIQFECGEDRALILVDGEVVGDVERDDDSASAAVKVIRALEPFLKPDVEVDLEGW